MIGNSPTMFATGSAARAAAMRNQPYDTDVGGFGQSNGFGQNAGSNRTGGSLTAYNADGVDPEQTLANITQADYANFLRDIQPTELELINKAQNDTSLIDQAVEDRENSNQLMQGIVDRNAGRYGAALTPAQIQQQKQSLAMGTTLGGIQGVNDARIAQKDANRALMADLIDIGQGVNRASLGSLGNAASAAASRESAYKNARAQNKAQTYSMLGTLGAAAMVFL